MTPSFATTRRSQLRVIATGGTFDKHYDPLAGQLTFADSHLQAIVERCRITAQVSLSSPFLMDSLDMRDEHRQILAADCANSADTGIVIIHGTDTMVESAKVIEALGLAKCVVLTGAMVPYEVAGSDALFNFGFALAAAQMLPDGVWVAMNGQIRPASDVRKDRQAGVFTQA